ncbi:MAG TPA: hypothetical protein VK116_15980, partial [Planctomycetota bacterium]|nr:hypothetical protein [Planctomycetota bacterium]
MGKQVNMAKWQGAVLALASLVATGCDGESYPKEIPASADVHSYVGACVSIGGERPEGGGGRFLRKRNDGAEFGFSTEAESKAARFVMKPSDIGTYLFRDAEDRHL